MALLDKSNMPEVARHIRSTKDVTVLQLTVNPSYKQGSKAGAYDTQTAQYACPVAGLEMSGRYRYMCVTLCVIGRTPQSLYRRRMLLMCLPFRFVFLRGCGCVISEKALKEVPSDTCHKV